MTSSRDYARFDAFLNKLQAEVYPEIPSDEHDAITQMMIADLCAKGVIRDGMRILDVGCGQGVALEQFRALGLDAVGVTLGPDAAVCRAMGLDVREMDQNFMTFPPASFDLLWCRHVLEHSVAPLFTLTEYHRLVKPGGWAYVEVPAPDTDAHHETNANHYSVLPLSAWQCLFIRAGFSVEHSIGVNLPIPIGTDTYWSFLLRRPPHR